MSFFDNLDIHGLVNNKPRLKIRINNEKHIFSYSKMSTKYKLGLRLKSWRKQRNLTQEELAEKITVSVHAISAIERGINFPSTTTLEKLSTILNIPLSEFYSFYRYRTSDCKGKIDKRYYGRAL
jgi:DNA-binding XRE family transcriptional regulator